MADNFLQPEPFQPLGLISVEWAGDNQFNAFAHAALVGDKSAERLEERTWVPAGGAHSLPV